jgi:DNA-binding CsgD family transcriptional regulator
MSEKESKLHVFANNGHIPLPNLLAIKDSDCRFVALTDTIKNRIGFQHIDDVIGITDHDINCPAAKYAHDFIKQDKQIMKMQQPKKFLDYYVNQDNDITLSIAEKSPIISEGVVQGLSISIVEMNLKNFNQFFLRLSKHILDDKHANDNSSYKYFEVDNLQRCDLNLTERQKEVLFLILRGNRSNEIAEQLFLSKRTVEDHINSLKDKFNCPNKAALIERAINNGYLNLLPMRFFKTLL